MSARAGMISLFATVLCVGFFLEARPVAQDSALKFTISGTSTVRRWSCPATGTIEVTPGGAGEAAPGFPDGVQTVTITVPVNAIACDEEDMVEHLREALKEPEHPEITYQLERYTMTGNNAATTTGEMTIAGVTKPIEFDVRPLSSPDGMRSEGETQIDMTDFSITPPDLWLGMLKVGKVVRVQFDAPLGPSE